MNQRGFDNQRSGAWLTAQQTAALLGVKRATVYAYAARGLLGAGTRGPGRVAQYAREAVERLKARAGARAGHTAVAAGALRLGEPVLDTQVSALDDDGPHYRGQSAVALARSGARYESVAELLWSGADGAWPPPAPAARPRAARPPDLLLRLAALTLDLALSDPGRLLSEPDAERRRARRVIVTLATHAGRHGSAALGCEGVAARLHASLLGRRASDDARRVLDAALVLAAEHELNASTFAARVAASVGADTYACLAAALCALSGPLHARFADAAEGLLAEGTSAARARHAVRRRVDAGEALPGFWSGTYRRGDPRGAALVQLAQDEPVLERARRPVTLVVEAARRAGAPPPSLDLGLAAVAHGLGLPPGSAAVLMAVARLAGVTAHVLEQRASGSVIRPRARYVTPAAPG